MKTRIEFSTLEELYEEGAKYLFDSQYGFVGEMEEDIDEQMHDCETKMEIKEKKIHRVYAMLPTGTLYVCKNELPESVPLFQLQGNFDVKKLHGMYRLMMEVMVKTAGKALAAKSGRTAEEDDMLDMMTNGGERVRAENLHAVLAWYRRR